MNTQSSGYFCERFALANAVGCHFEYRLSE